MRGKRSVSELILYVDGLEADYIPVLPVRQRDAARSTDTANDANTTPPNSNGGHAEGSTSNGDHTEENACNKHTKGATSDQKRASQERDATSLQSSLHSQRADCVTAVTS
jgi:hypothetical protein